MANARLVVDRVDSVSVVAPKVRYSVSGYRGDQRVAYYFSTSNASYSCKAYLENSGYESVIHLVFHEPQEDIVAGYSYEYSWQKRGK